MRSSLDRRGKPAAGRPGKPRASLPWVLCVRGAGGLCLFLLLAGPDIARAEKGSAGKAARPNVVWIIGDDHAAYVCGAYGSTLARTPNIDRLAGSGVRFDRAYCNSPMCTPSRQSFLTGRLPHAVGVTLLRTPLAQREVTLAEHLAGLGYQTAAIGKMHFNSNLRHGFKTRIGMPEHRAWAKAHKPRRIPPGVEVLPPWRPFKDHARVWLNAMNVPFGLYDADMPGTYFAREAAAYIREHKDQPFFLIASFFEPHSPFRYPLEYRAKFRPDEMEAPRVGPEDGWQIPAIFADLTDDEKRGIAAAYYTSTEFMDKNVGIVMDALEKSGLGEKTLVCYFGDHGYDLGHHGRFEKHCFYEPAVRAPLLFSWKGVVPAGRSTEALTEFVDIVPTVLDLCGLPAMKRVHGRSMKNVVLGGSDAGRRYVFSEYGHNEEAMIRTARYKLIYQTGKRQRDDGYLPREPVTVRRIRLYDLPDDPGEFRDVADEPDNQAVVAELLDVLEQRLLTAWEGRATFEEGLSQLERIDRMLVPAEEAGRGG